MILKLKHKKFYYVKFAFRLQTAGTDRYAIHNYHHHEKIYDIYEKLIITGTEYKDCLLLQLTPV